MQTGQGLKKGPGRFFVAIAGRVMAWIGDPVQPGRLQGLLWDCGFQEGSPSFTSVRETRNSWIQIIGEISLFQAPFSLSKFGHHRNIPKTLHFGSSGE